MYTQCVPHLYRYIFKVLCMLCYTIRYIEYIHIFQIYYNSKQYTIVFICNEKKTIYENSAISKVRIYKLTISMQNLLHQYFTIPLKLFHIVHYLYILTNNTEYCMCITSRSLGFALQEQQLKSLLYYIHINSTIFLHIVY